MDMDIWQNHYNFDIYLSNLLMDIYSLNQYNYYEIFLIYFYNMYLFYNYLAFY